MADASGSGGLARLALLCMLGLPISAAAISAGGCFERPHTLETGYQYQPLNSSGVQRRAFYADPHSVEARRAEAERQQRSRGTGAMPLQP